ncbi:MAG: hypothetical protein FWG13_08720 [Leptospirales bacterium]|nr:hypothetical protein [Leptospirales bacterium]
MINIGKTKKIISTAKSKIVYLPFVGWFITLIANRGDDDFIVSHIKQSFALALGFTICLIALGFLLTLTRHGILKLTFVTIIYLAYLLYFAMSVIGTRAVLRGKKIEFPVIGSYAARLNI